MNWDKATDLMVYSALATVAVLGVMGVYQWISRKSFKKIDKSLLALLVPLVLVVVTWFIFDYVFVLNTRPDGTGEPSFPSTHTMITATVFFCTAILLPKYIKQKYLLILLDFIMFLFVILVPIGRVIANKHWTSDVIGGLIFAAIYTGAYFATFKLITKGDQK